MSGTLALLAAVALVVANGFFVLVEFSLVATSPALYRADAERGDRRAGLVMKSLDNLSLLLSAAQFGISLTSLVLGFLAEGAMREHLTRPIVDGLGLPEGATSIAALVVAIALATFLQMIIGELVPKALALARPTPIALRTARLAAVYIRATSPVVRLLDRAALVLARVIFNADPGAEGSGVGREELVSAIRDVQAGGDLDPDTSELLSRAVGLGDRRVRSIQVALPDVVWVDAAARLDRVRDLCEETGLSRFPVRGRDDDDVVGTIHIKDLLKIPRDEWVSRRVRNEANPALIVPELATLQHLLATFRKDRRTFAVTIDEFGSTAGLVTFEDLVEELVGEIDDEFDTTVRGVRPIAGGDWLLDASLRPDEIAAQSPIVLPSGNYETLAGLVLEQLGRVPRRRDAIDVAGWRLRVADLDEHRILLVRASQIRVAEEDA